MNNKEVYLDLDGFKKALKLFDYLNFQEGNDYIIRLDIFRVDNYFYLSSEITDLNSKPLKGGQEFIKFSYILEDKICSKEDRALSGEEVVKIVKEIMNNSHNFFNNQEFELAIENSKPDKDNCFMIMYSKDSIHDLSGSLE